MGEARFRCARPQHSEREIVMRCCRYLRNPVDAVHHAFDTTPGSKLREFSFRNAVVNGLGSSYEPMLIESDLTQSLQIGQHLTHVRSIPKRVTIVSWWADWI